MKTLLTLLIVAILAGFVLINPLKIQALGPAQKLLYLVPCDEPVLYGIGTIDKRFGINEQELITDLKKAEIAWESAAGKNLFDYDPQAKLKVNLVYDKRQDLSNQIYDLKGEIENEKNSLKPEMEAYEGRSRAFQDRLSVLNQRIESFNQQGGAPEEEYNKLIEEQKNLQQEASELNALARKLNRTSDEFANKVGELNQTVNRFNNALSVRPEEGLYDPNNNVINIYFHSDPSEFVHTLAHELGHARGLDHTNDTNAIMYTQTNGQVVPTADDLQLLSKACMRRSYAEIATERVQYLYQMYTNKNKAINQGKSS